MNTEPTQAQRNRWRFLIALLVAATAPFGSAFAQATFTVVNNCGYTIYPGIYPADYQNGGWAMTPGTSVSFTVPAGFNGRIWGRLGCNGSSPAICATGQCGGTGLQCAGTTGVAGTSLAEFNLDASGTDYYDVSYVDGFDNPIGITVSNSSCVSPNTCTSAPLNSCSANLLSGNGEDCLSPCTEYGTNQYCCTGAYGSAATCLPAQWPAAEASYVTDIHNSCPREYAYAYDDSNGLQTCPTGSSYTVTFCPSGPTLNGAYTLGPQNAPGMLLDDYFSGTGSGNPIDIWGADNTGAQVWVFSNLNVVPTGYYNIAVSYGPYCVTSTGSTSGSVVNLQLCNGSLGQAWNVVSTGSHYILESADNTSLCLAVQNAGTTDGTLVVAATCDGGSEQSWAFTAQ
jgi:hypothetical protein